MLSNSARKCIFLLCLMKSCMLFRVHSTPMSFSEVKRTLWRTECKPYKFETRHHFHQPRRPHQVQSYKDRPLSIRVRRVLMPAVIKAGILPKNRKAAALLIKEYGTRSSRNLSSRRLQLQEKLWAPWQYQSCPYSKRSHNLFVGSIGGFFAAWETFLNDRYIFHGREIN